MHAAHGEVEEATWKRKKKAEQEVDMAVREYDTEIAERHAEVQQEEAALQGLQARMQVRCAGQPGVTGGSVMETTVCWLRGLFPWWCRPCMCTRRLGW